MNKAMRLLPEAIKKDSQRAKLNKRMILGILDNIRNYLLISINQQLVNN